MGPPLLALGLLMKEAWSRRLQAKAMVRQDRIISQEPVGQVAVEGGQVAEPHILVIVHEIFLDRAMEPFHMRVHCGGTGLGPPVGQIPLLQALLEAAAARRAGVGEQEARRGRQEVAQGLEGEGRLAAGLAGPGEAGVRGDEGEQISPPAVPQAHHGIAGEDLEGGGVAAGIEAAGSLAPRVRDAGDQAADGGDARDREPLLRTPGPPQDLEFGLAEIGRADAQAPACLAQGWGLQDLASPPRGPGASSEGRGMAPSGAARLLPARACAD